MAGGAVVFNGSADGALVLLSIMAQSGCALATRSFFSFTPGFSQVSVVTEVRRKPFKWLGIHPRIRHATVSNASPN
jgi:hypothetical protein